MSINIYHPIYQSVFDSLHEIEDSCEMDCFFDEEKPRAKEACLIIAEVMMLNPNNEMRINGVLLSVRMVQEVYSKITHEHIKYVLESISKCRYEIKNQKMYLRTALYNSVFQLENHLENEYRRNEE